MSKTEDDHMIDDLARSAIRLLAFHVEQLLRKTNTDAEAILEVRQLRDSLQPPTETPITPDSRGVPDEA
jgi:hypothetical protein